MCTRLRAFDCDCVCVSAFVCECVCACVWVSLYVWPKVLVSSPQSYQMSDPPSLHSSLCVCVFVCVCVCEYIGV